MSKYIWSENYQSVCQLTFYDDEKNRMSSGTGFLMNNNLLTNNHVYSFPNASEVEITFVKDDGHTIDQKIRINNEEFRMRLINGSPASLWDYAIIDIDNLDIKRPSLRYSKSKNGIDIGMSISVLGYQFDQRNLSIKNGTVSSKYNKATVNYIQLDCSINHGNSGGPIINNENSEVIGIVTRKHTGLTEAFDELIESYNRNLNFLNRVNDPTAFVQVGGVNPVESMLITQSQMLKVSKQLRRSTNVGIGIGFQLDEIMNYYND